MCTRRSTSRSASSYPPRARAEASGPSSPPVRQIESLAMFGDIGQHRGAFGLVWLAQFEARDEAAEVLVAGLGFGEQRQAHRLRRNAMRQPWRRTGALPASLTAISAPMCARVPARWAAM